MSLLSSPSDLPVAPSDDTLPWRWSTGYATLGPAFATPWSAQALAPEHPPHWVGHSPAVASLLGLPADWTRHEAWLQFLSGARPLPGSSPVATVYSGHQFGVWAGQLGDGRALLLGETDGGLEIQLKGSGRTPYSRMGDGRAVLRSSIREFLCSEAMHALGIPTTRALCVIGSHTPVRRETIETAAVVTRVARSFLRFGHFEHYAATGDIESLRRLADYVVDRYYADVRHDDRWQGNAYAALLEAVCQRTAEMLAGWQSVGFCHGVMNTDNMSILGLTLDYGPFQFLDGYDPAHICNHTDVQGRYAFARQPQIAHWNLYCLAQALMPLIQDQEMALRALQAYGERYSMALEGRLRDKLGLLTVADDDRPLIEDTLRLLGREKTDYSVFWRRLTDHAASAQPAALRDLFLDTAALDAWLARYDARFAREDAGASVRRMQQCNPRFVFRNYIGEQVIARAREDDFAGVAEWLAVLERPFDEHPEQAWAAGLAPAWAAEIAISCSS